MAKSHLLAPEAQAPEVYRHTPYEYALTAEPVQSVMTCGEAIPSPQSWVKTAGRVERKPVLPQWMTSRPAQR